MTRLPASKRLGTSTAALLVIASMVGTGVFTTGGLLLRELGNPIAVLLAFLVGGLLAMAGALSYAELTAALPRNGGEYQLLGRIFHPALGFAAGVVSFLVGFAAPIAASALAFGIYLEALWPALPSVAWALALLVALAALHSGRIALGRRVQDGLTWAKMVLLLAFLVAGLVFGSASRLAPVEASPLVPALLSPSFAIALVYVSYSYSGWNAATYVAGELASPGRSLPRALILGTLAVTLLYVGLNAAFLVAAPMEALSGRVEVGHVAAIRLLGEGAGRALSAAVAFGLISTVGALLFTGTRVIEAMAQDHRLLWLFAGRPEARGPMRATLLLTGTAAVMTLGASFEALLGYVGFTLSLFAALTVLGVIVLRHREPELPRPYRVPLYPLVPILFVLGAVWMVVYAILARPLVTLFGGLTIAGSLLAYLPMRVRS